MPSQDTVIYNAKKAGSVTLEHPSITVTHNTVISAYRKYTVLVRITYTVRALLIAADASGLDILIENCRTALSVSGGYFSADYGAEILEASPKTDVSGGPHPTYLNITKIYGGRTAIVTWQLRTEKNVRDDNVSDVGAWLDFVYTVETNLDPNFYATRTISGLVRFSSCHRKTQKYSADAFRKVVEDNIAPIPKVGAWQRVTRSFRLSEDQKILAFTITDRQLYTFLPRGMTMGDVTITTTAEKYGKGRYVVRGWFEAPPTVARGPVQKCAREVLQMFTTNVLEIIETETNKLFSIHDERCSYTCRWRSNRVDFEASYIILGEFNPPSMPENIEYTVNRALRWLANMSRAHRQPIRDLGPDGSIPVLGPKGSEKPGPRIRIDPIEKLPEGFAYGAEAPPPAGPAPEEVTQEGQAVTTYYTSYHQHFEYKHETGRVFIPVKAANYSDVVQCASNRRVFLIITGEAESTGKEPELPPRPHTVVGESAETDQIVGAGITPRMVLVESTVIPSSPTAAGEYKLAWRYIYRFTTLGPWAPYKWPYTPLNEVGSNLLLPIVRDKLAEAEGGD